MKEHKRRLYARVASNWAIALLIIGATGCATQTQTQTPKLHHVNTQHEAGSTDIAITYVEPWDAVASDLAPKFEMTSAIALNEVIPNTTNEINRFLDALSGRVGIGLSGTTTTSTQSQTQQSGQPATNQSTTTQQTQPGQVPDSAATSPAGNRTAQGLPGTDVLGKDTGQDPLLQHTAALALYQEVKLLNRYVLGAARRSNRVPYLVRLQVSLMPYAHYEPYDSYVNISFFTMQDPSGNNAGALKTLLEKLKPQENNGVDSKEQNHVRELIRLPVVIPLVVTDALEGGLTSTTSEVVRQLALALSATIDNAQAKADFQKLQDNLRSITGTNLNSLQTIGRFSDNGVRVRLGAVHSPIEGDAYVMVPGTHNVTLLLLVPKEWVDEHKQSATNEQYRSVIQVVAHNVFYDAIKGTRLNSITPEEWDNELKTISHWYLHNKVNTPLKYVESCPQARPSESNEQAKLKIDLLQYLTARVGDGDFRCFSLTLSENYSDLNDANFLWNELTIVAGSYGYSLAYFELPMQRNPEAPPKQTVLLLDDRKNAAVAHLLNGVGVVSDRLVASLAITTKDGDNVTLPAQSITVTGSDLQLSFPSLIKWGIASEQEDGKRMAGGTKTNDVKPNTGETQSKDGNQKAVEAISKYGIKSAKIILLQRQDPWTFSANEAMSNSPGSSTQASNATVSSTSNPAAGKPAKLSTQDPAEKNAKGSFKSNTAMLYDFSCVDKENVPCNDYQVIFQVAPNTVEPEFKFDTAITTIPVMATGNTGQMSVYLTFTSGKADMVSILATGGEIQPMAAKDVKGPPGAEASVSGGVVTVKAPTSSSAPENVPPPRVEIVLHFGNLVDGGTMKLAATGYKNGKATSDAQVISVAVKGPPQANTQAKTTPSPSAQ